MRGESYQLLSRLDLSKLVKQSAVTLGKGSCQQFLWVNSKLPSPNSDSHRLPCHNSLLARFQSETSSGRLSSDKTFRLRGNRFRNVVGR